MIAPVNNAPPNANGGSGNTFFDTKLLRALMEKQRILVLKKVGVYGQKTIRSKLKPQLDQKGQSVRKQRKRNKDGKLRKLRRTKYPRHHHGSLRAGLRNVQFSFYDPDGGVWAHGSHQVAIGSVKFSNTPKRPSKPNGWAFSSYPNAKIWVNPLGGKTIPQLLNEGGAGKMNIQLKGGKTLVEAVRYKEQPYVTDSLDRTAKAALRIFKSTPLKN